MAVCGTCRTPVMFVHPQVRKYRTMTELIIDATEYVKNPYKGKKLKVRPEAHSVMSLYKARFWDIDERAGVTDWYLA